MPNWKPTILLGIFLANMLCCAQRPRPDEGTGQKVLGVCVVNYPLQYLAERIGGDRVQVTFPGPPDEDPAYWMPDAAAISQFQDADVILLNGADYAKWRQTVSLPEQSITNTTLAVADRYIMEDGTFTHSHGDGSQHAHGGLAFTTWLDPQIAIAQARAIRDAFIIQQPHAKAEFEAAFATVETELLQLDQRLRELLTGDRLVPIVFSHPVYQYFQRAYGLPATSVHWEPDQYPTAGMWHEFSGLLERHPADVMIWESEPREDIRRQLDALGVQSVVYDPCANRGPDGDFLGTMRKNVQRLTQALGEVAP